ncbi:MAG TPA: glycosyltransferase family 61 protein, partial [Ideonella sp.]|nr:glycosyltransferase family 61 protein [Ideonella sp.]
MDATAVDPPPTPSSPAALLARLQALAAMPGRRWPGGDALAARLARDDAAAAARLRLAHAVHTEWLKGQAEPPDELQDVFIDCVDWAWQGLDDDERLASGLYPALIRALGARHQVEALSALAARLIPFAAEAEAEHAMAALLRQLRQHKQHAALHALLDALRPAWQPGLAWGAPLLAGVLALARDADDFAALRSAAAWLPELLEAAEAADAAADPATQADPNTWRELGRLALRTLQVDSMQRVAAAMLRGRGDPSGADQQALLIQILGLLASFAPDARTRVLLDQAAAQQPKQPALLLGRARIAHAEGAPLAELVGLLNDVDPTLPGAAAAMSWLAGTLFHGGDDAGALAIYEQLADRQALSAADRLRLNHLLARDAAAGDGAAATDGAQNGAAAPEPILSPETLGPFAPALAPLLQLLEQPPMHDAALDADALAEAGDAACAHWRQALPALHGISMQACLQLARQFAQLEAGAFASHTQWLAAFPFELGPAYGRVDARRCRALGRTLQRHLLALCEFALARPQALQGAPGQASLRQALDLAEMCCEARWALGEGEQALADVAALQERLGPLGRQPLSELQARCLLSRRGHADPAELAGVAALLDSEGSEEVLALTPWADWLATEDLHPQTLVDDPAREGRFESVQPDGRLLGHVHRLAPTQLTVLHHRDLRVRNSHLVIGPRGGIMRPGPWHLSMGDYPYEHRHVRLRGGGIDAVGAVLRPARWQRVDTPVVVLANQDATYHRNYYHWMLLILARIDALRARGLLVGGRKLLLPRELSGWMRASLEAIGIADEQMLLYGNDDDLQLTDAVLTSPLDYANPSLVEGLRQTLWRHAGLDPSAPPEATRLLYISRRGEGRRPLVEEARIQHAAESLGFEAVAPETLTLAEQVRLFATARGIAGPPGAA